MIDGMYVERPSARDAIHHALQLYLQNTSEHRRAGRTCLQGGRRDCPLASAVKPSIMRLSVSST